MFVNNNLFVSKMNYNLKKDTPINTLDKIMTDITYNRTVQNNFDKVEFKKNIISKLGKSNYDTSIKKKSVEGQITDHIKDVNDRVRNFKNTMLEYDKEIESYESAIKEGKGTPLMEKCIESLKSQKQQYFDKNSPKLESDASYMSTILPIQLKLAVIGIEYTKGLSNYTEYKDMIHYDVSGKKHVYGRVRVVNEKFYQDFDMSCFNNFTDKLKETLKKGTDDEDFYSSLDEYIKSFDKAISETSNIFSKLKLE